MEQYLTTEEFAAVARTAPSTVRYWHHIGKGPTSIKLGRRRLYAQSVVEKWLASGGNPASEAAA